jgi:hypothetical protein
MLSELNAMLAIINIRHNLPTPATIKFHPVAPLTFFALELIVYVCFDGGGVTCQNNNFLFRNVLLPFIE